MLPAFRGLPSGLLGCRKGHAIEEDAGYDTPLPVGGQTGLLQGCLAAAVTLATVSSRGRVLIVAPLRCGPDDSLS